MKIAKRNPMRFYADYNLASDELTKRLQQDIMPAFNCDGNLQLLMIVTPAKNSTVYAPIKRYCDTVAGIASQCIYKQNIRYKGKDSGFASNVLMKINSKLGGINVTLREMPAFVKTGTVCSPSD